MGYWLLVALLATDPSLPNSEGSVSGETGAGAEEAHPKAAEESFDIDVQEALTKKQSRSDQASGAILTTASVQDVRSRGYPTLAEYLNDEVPGFRYAPAFYHRWPDVRGTPGAANLLLNGVSATSPIDYRFASDAALFLDRVETISGPAGVPWGGYSLLGVVNLLVTNTAPDGTTMNFGYGTRDFQRFSVRDVRTFGDSKLRLFFGYAGERDNVDQPEWQYHGIPPYARSYDGGKNSERVTPSNDSFSTFSAYYSRPTLDAYIRLPYADEHYQISEFGGVLPAGHEGERTNVDGVAFVSWHDAFLSGRLALLARAVWSRFY